MPTPTSVVLQKFAMGVIMAAGVEAQVSPWWCPGECPPICDSGDCVEAQTTNPLELFQAPADDGIDGYLEYAVTFFDVASPGLCAQRCLEAGVGCHAFIYVANQANCYLCTGRTFTDASELVVRARVGWKAYRRQPAASVP